MEITKREIIASITIIAVWICIGFAITGKMDTWQQDKNAEYDKAAKIEDQKIFEHGMDTNLGNAFVYGELEAKTPVSFPEIDGEYSSIKKIKERYTRHTRTVTKTRTKLDGKTETYTEIEVYWTWDEVDRERKKTEILKFLGNEFKSDLIRLPSEEYIDTAKESHDVRYVFYGTPKKMKGTLYTTLKNGSIKEDSKFYDGISIDRTVDVLETEIYKPIFWVIWIIMMIGLVCGFYYLDNRWLNK